MVLRWRSSRESRLILSSEVATRNVCLVRANYSIEESLWSTTRSGRDGPAANVFVRSVAAIGSAADLED